MFDPQRVLAGQKIADRIVKSYENADPREVVIGLAIALVGVSNVVSLRKQHLQGLIETLYNALNNPAVGDVQEAASRLILPR